MPKWITIAETGLPKSRVDAWIRRGTIKTKAIGKRANGTAAQILVSAEEIEALRQNPPKRGPRIKSP